MQQNTPIYSVVPFSRKCWCGKLPNERVGFKIWLGRLWFKLITRGNFAIYYTMDSNGMITHTSYLVGKCFKFPFLNQNDYEIGPCFTHPAYRGQGLYPLVLNHITQTHATTDNFYMLVSPTNKASIRGIEKANFTYIGKTYKTRTKRYIGTK